MARKREMLDKIFCIPMTKTMRQKISELAVLNERRPAEMGRILVATGIETFERKMAAESQNAQLTAPAQSV